MVRSVVKLYTSQLPPMSFWNVQKHDRSVGNLYILNSLLKKVFGVYKNRAERTLIWHRRKAPEVHGNACAPRELFVLAGKGLVLLLFLPALVEVSVQHPEAIPPVSTRSAVGHNSALPLDLAQGEQTHPEVSGRLLGGH